ncbi:MAG: ATP-binding protein [Candidatus Moranbacteria bacterium]|nr:ATP-binding protein [Candidatus Moranbacteria bacterium]
MMQIIFGAAALNFLVGVLLLIQRRRTKEIIAFGVFSLITGVWGLSNFLIYYYNSGVFLESAYAFGALTASSMLAWSFLYKQGSNRTNVAIFIYALGILIFCLSYVNGYAIGDIRGITASGVDADPGLFSDEYSLFVLVSLLWSLANVFSVFRKSIGFERKQARLVLVGLFVFVGVTIIVSAILPIFGILGYTNLDSPSSLIFVIFVAFAIVRYHFLETRVILAQVLVGALATVSIIQLLSSTTVFDVVITMISLCIVLGLGIFLVRSVFNDIQHKNELQRVNVQLKRSKQRLGQVNEHLMQLDQAKTDFINIASHQLRTPLGSMRWSMEMILADEMGPISDSAKDALREIYENNQRMGDLVNDLLSVARIEQGKVVEKAVATDIASVISEAVKMMQPEAKHRQITLRFDMPTKDIPSIMVAPKRFFEVIQNLISNAIKYNRPEGMVIVAMEVSTRHMRISVTDTGIGIPQSEHAKIFSKFFRAGNALSTNTEGTGLGLFVAKSFVEENGGIIRFKSEEGVGTTFIIELPITVPTAQEDQRQGEAR